MDKMDNSDKWVCMIIINMVIVIIACLLLFNLPFEIAIIVSACIGPIVVAFIFIWPIVVYGIMGKKCAETPIADDISKALKDESKIRPVLSLADRAHAETIRYREHVWKVVVWTLTLLGATLWASKNDIVLAKMSYFKYICGLFAVLVTAFGIRDVFFDYDSFVKNRNTQRKCERLLKFFQEDIYLQGKPLMSKDFQTTDYTIWDCFCHLIQWWFVIYTAGIFVISAILFEAG